MEINWLFWCATALFTGIGYLLSKTPILGETGLASTIFGAGCLMFFGYIVDVTGASFSRDCKHYGQSGAIIFDTEGCLNAGDKINIVADTLTSTLLGFNPIYSAIVFYILIKGGLYIYRKFWW
jgi:hypothetical protein